MAKIQFLTILLTVTCFLGSVVSVTDKEFEDLVTQVHHQAGLLEEQSVTNQLQSETIDKQTALNEEQSITIGRQSMTIDRQSSLIQQLQKDNEAIMEKLNQQEVVIQVLNSKLNFELPQGNDDDSFQNTTIEERVTLLEIQVTDLREDLTTTEENVDDLDQDVNFLFDEQIIQDERLFNLEQETDVIDTRLLLIDNDLENLEDTTFSLDSRVTVLEENGGSDGNSSVAELEVRVEVLEGTATDHETRISAAEVDVNDLENITSDHGTRLTAAEENIQGLQFTDVELDERVTALEENGGGSTRNETIAFHTVLTSSSSISEGSPVLFNEVLLNERDGYDSTTGTFTVPPGGDGFYYFSVYLLVDDDKYAIFDIRVNGEMICTAQTDQQETPTNEGQAACSAAYYVTEGDEVQVIYDEGTDTDPFWGPSTSWFWHGFTGFRI